MASVIIESTKSGRKRYRVAFRDEHGVRKAIRLVGVSKRDAGEIASKVQAIVSARISGAPLANAVAEWLAGIGDELHGKLSAAGLCGGRRLATLEEFVESLIAEWEAAPAEARPALSTITNRKQTRDKLFASLGKQSLVRNLTAEHAAAWREGLVRKHAAATVAKHVKIAKLFFREAEDRGYLEKSPFAKLVAGDDSNDERKAYVPAADVEKLMDVAPDCEWRLLIALARFGGLRTPSESLRLRWADINWADGTMRVTTPKTAKQGKASRIVPLFEELLPYLLDAREVAPADAEFSIMRYRDLGTNLGTHLERLVERPGLVRWPRLWHALRASRATDLADRFPSHVAADWLGHTEEIAKKNYRSVTPEHMAMARGDAGGGAQGRGITPRRPLHPQQETPRNPVLLGV